MPAAAGNRARRGAVTTGVRRRTLLRLAGAVLALAAGCTGVPDRAAEAGRISGELRELPGVRMLSDTYTNDYTAGVSYQVRATLTSHATADQAATVAEHYYRATGQGFEGYSTRLVLTAGDDQLSLYGKAPADPERQAQLVRRWWLLRSQLTAALDWADTDISRPGPAGSVQLRPDRPLPEALDEVRRHAADLTGIQWIVFAGRSRLDLFGAVPDPQTTAVLHTLTAEGDWSISYDPTAAPALSLSVWAPDGAPLDRTARAQATLLAGLDHPSTYTLKPRGADHIVVAVHGCLTGGSALQQQLNAEFGNC